METTIYKLGDKIHEILSSVWGWVAGAVIFLANSLMNYIAGYEMNLAIITFVCVLDAAWGIARSVKCNKYTTSELMRETISKLLVYATILLVFIGVDHVCGWEKSWTSDIVSALICLVEVYSIMGNILIVYPKFPVISLLRKVVEGEIASKLGIDADDVDEALKGKKTLKNKKV